jgi:hypothetical protein
MKKLFKASAISTIPLAFLLLVLSVGLSRTVSAQHLISTRAGFVNRVEGKVYIQRLDNEDGEKGRASLGTQMRDGDRLMTADDSRAELLLQPGSYLRLDEETEVRAVNTSLTRTHFELIKGSAIIEVGQIDKRTPIEIGIPQGTLSINKSGLYRFDTKGAMTLVSVWKGHLYLGTADQVAANKATKVKSGKVARLAAQQALNVEIAKLDQDVFDDFDQWSMQRAEMLVAANYSVLRRSQYGNALVYGWVYDPFYNCYTFVPGSWQIISPYGFAFYRSYHDCACYLPYYYPYYGAGPYQGGGATGGGSSTALKPSVTPRIAPSAISDGGRGPIHREISPGRTIDPGSRSISPVDSGSSRSIGPVRSIDTGSAPASAPPRGIGGTGSDIPSRPVEGSRPITPDIPW